jgi:hypothetical protein
MAADASRENGKKGGRPKGSKSKSTLAKEEAREYYRQRLMGEIDDIADAHLSRCKGVRYFVTRNKTGKYEIVTDPDKVVAALNGEDDMTGEFYTEKPDIQAIREALDRTLDRSKEQEQAVEIKGNLRLIHEVPT